MTADRPLRTADFDYDLPPELIAQVPSARRGESRLLVVGMPEVNASRAPASGERELPGSTEPKPSERGERELPAHAGRVAPPPVGSAVPSHDATSPPDRQDFAVPSHQVTPPGVEGAQTVPLHDTTFAALANLIPPGDLLVLNTTRVRHARFLGTRPSGAPAEVLLIHPATGGEWVALGKPGSAMKPGKRIRIGPDAEIETVAVLEDGNRVVRFVGLDASTAIDRYGRLPLPPYITRDPDTTDEDRYQTVYAEREGSVAAPTAGLHFTPELLGALEATGVRIARLELEVGPGTFKPVEGEEIMAHPMHPERYLIPEVLVEAVADTRLRDGKVWAVGTTVVRALEAASDAGGGVRPGPGETRLMITPGYRFKVVDRLITNFHLPRSTLLMLVAAFAGMDTMRAAYAHAIRERYRFYSYGDAMVVVP